VVGRSGQTAYARADDVQDANRAVSSWFIANGAANGAQIVAFRASAVTEGASNTTRFIALAQLVSMVVGTVILVRCGITATTRQSSRWPRVRS